MRSLFKSIQYISAALLALAISSCTEPEIYHKAGIPEGGQVYFANVPSNIDLSDGSGTFSIAVYRADASSDFTVNLTSEADSAVFTIPSSVSFKQGLDVTVIPITYDPEKVVTDKVYEINIAVDNNDTPYGRSECKFKAVAASPWQVLCKAVFTETYWGEVHHSTIYYRDEGNLRYCLVKGDEPCDEICVPAEESEQKGAWGDGDDFTFIWHRDLKDARGNELIEVTPKFLYVHSSYGPCYACDYYTYYSQLTTGYSGTFEEFYNKFGESQFPLSYYDGKGGFYFNVQYGFPEEGGYFEYSYDVIAIDDEWKSKRTTDYNTAIDYSAAYEATAKSMMFSNDGVSPVEFDVQIRYDDNYSFDPEEFDPAKDEVIKTTYYVKDYFDEGSGLAFTAPIPELLEDGSDVENVANEQNTGLNVFGNTLFVKIKKGTVEFAEDSEFPIFNVAVAAYTKKPVVNNETGEVTYSDVVNDFGQFVEAFEAVDYASDRYTLDDLNGANKADYLGLFNKVFMYMDSQEDEMYDGEVMFSNAGGANVAITNLSDFYGFVQNKGVDTPFDDTVIATWDSQTGMLLIYPQVLEGKLTVQGHPYEMAVGVGDPASGVYYTKGLPLIGGFTDEGSIAFVAHPEYSTCFGLYWYSTDKNFGGLCWTYDIIAYPGSGSSVLSVSDRKAAPYRKEVIVKNDFTIEANPFAVKPKEVRKINTANVKPVVKTSTKKNFEFAGELVFGSIGF